MKIIITALILFFSTAVIAQDQNNRALVFNKELKILVGNWEGTSVYTDPKRNNMQVYLKAFLEVTDLGDSLMLRCLYIDAQGNESSDTSILRIHDKEDQLRIDHDLYNIVSTARKGGRMEVVGERAGYDNSIKPGFDMSLRADFRQTITFNAANLKMVKELRFMENDYLFIRRRSTFTKK